MFKRLPFLTFFLLLMSLTPLAQAKLNVVTTTQDPAWLTQTIGGERVSVIALCKGYQDPHFLDAKPSFMVDLNRADLVEYIGLELEVGYLPSLLTGARNNKLAAGQPGNLDLSQFIKPLELVPVADRGQGDIHPNGNPHYWLDPENARAMARGIAGRLTQLDPAGKAIFTANLATFEKTLTEKEADWARRMAPLAKKPIVTYHKSWTYLAARYGLEVAGFIEPKPGIPPSPAHTLEILKLIPQRGIKAILVENYYDKRVPELIASKTGATLLQVPNSVLGDNTVDTYFKLIERIISELEKTAH